MPASLPGSTDSANRTGNPAAGSFVLFSPFSGPKGSPFDKDTAGNASTGALSTGIGFGSPPIIGPTAPASIKAAGFTDDYTPGVTMPDGTTASANSKLVAIGGGKSTANVAGNAPTVPYVAGFALVGAGNSGSRDATAGPAYQGFAVKTVTASGTVANGSAVETGFTNRSGASITTGQSVFGSSTTASGAIS